MAVANIYFTSAVPHVKCNNGNGWPKMAASDICKDTRQLRTSRSCDCGVSEKKIQNALLIVGKNSLRVATVTCWQCFVGSWWQQILLF